MAIAPLGQVAQVLTHLYRARLAYKALRGIVNAPQERPIAKRFVYKPELDGEIAFHDLTFTYPDEKTPALSGVSFKLGKGERVARSLFTKRPRGYPVAAIGLRWPVVIGTSGAASCSRSRQSRT